MSPSTTSTLVSDLQELAAGDKWDFPTWSPREQSHGLFQYPAMMLPQMQRELLDRLRVESSASAAYDPFVGSGTTLAEAMLQGIDFLGTDINPLAILLCRAKAGPFFIDALADAGTRVVAASKVDRESTISLEWDGWEKWFRKDVAVGLSKLRRAIRGEKQPHARRFLWVCLAETVRLTSNSRTSTVKLHVRPTGELKDRPIDPLGAFARIFASNLERFRDYRDELREAGFVQSGHYQGTVELHLHDVTSGAVPRATDDLCSVLLTSPPYGDNNTTVPYGQHAYLPLRWIDVADIDEAVDDAFLISTHAIDSMSLGAPLRGALKTVEALRATSPALDEILEALSNQRSDRQNRVAAFWRDLDTSLDHILASLAPDALMAWTVGNRRVGGRQVPMDAILIELLEHRGCESVTTLSRVIPDGRKRMAPRNSVSDTMSTEKVLVLRAPAANA